MTYHLGQVFRSECTPYRYFIITEIGKKKVTVLEQYRYLSGYLIDDLTQPLRREPFKMTKRPGGILSYGLKYFEPMIASESPQLINPIVLVGGILSTIGMFIVSAYFIVGI